ncbi:DUF1552 domain-containing protein [Sandaracinus amylolyticus]|uniref:Tat (Twin-arginine translocation) pathway signal sequence domain protein n=1 Tax=Sandaracinus amylolyticus TaxID=927083 RepID=A0A0F6W9Q1_9BACT|nr:DUF1552 domain-containing protein [Sandaracinus amylolyticus]AKF10946.1 hypothetical protein DB32_008095 [Sandaracinus amylolyticus]
MNRFSRRQVLRGAGVALALPLLESLMPRTARAGTMPTRFVVITTGQGTLLPRWTPPVRAGEALELSELLMPLAPHRDDLVVVSGIDNLMPRYHLSNGHNAPGHTLLNAHLCTSSATSDGRLLPEGSRSEVAQATLCVGPSIDHHLADRIGSPLPLNLAVNGTNAGENRMYYRVAPENSAQPNGARAEARLIGDPVRVFDEFLAGSSGAPTTLRERLRGQRGRVLDALGGSYSALARRVSAADRARLEAHAERLAELEASLGAPAITCDDPTLSLPPGYPSAGRSDLHWRAQIDVMVTALTCNVTRVASIHDADYHGPSFEFLQAPMPSELIGAGARALPGSAIADWHAQVHGDTGGAPNENANLIAGFTFYATQVSYLLERMKSVIEPDGSTLLDNSVVLWISEFGNGGAHSTQDLPVVLAGRAGGALTPGRHLARPDRTTGDLYTSILRMFGVDVDSFGFAGDSDLQHGGVGGL